MFWNIGRDTKSMDGFGKLTVNMKCFEIFKSIVML